MMGFRPRNAAPAGHPIHLGSGLVWHDRALADEIAAAVGGASLVSVPAGPAVKPPMVPSDVPALRGFPWTDAAAGLRVLIAAERAA